MKRLPDPTFDQRLADWLEGDPSLAPREVLDTVLAAYPSIEQRRAARVPWGYPAMFNNRLAIAAAAIVAVVAIGAIGIVRSASVGPPGPVPTPSAPPSIVGTWDVTFTPQEMLDAGILGHIADDPADSGHFHLTFTADTWQVSHLDPPIWVSQASTYTAEPGIVHLGAPGDDSYNTPYSVTAKTLTLGAQAPTWLAVKSWTRIAAEPLASAIPRPPETRTIGLGDLGVVLDPGPYRVDGFAIPIRFTLPAGWAMDAVGTTNVSLARASDGKVNIAFLVVNKVYPDPCHPETGPTAYGSSVDELVSALSAITDFDVANVTEATVGGAAGKQFDFLNAIDVVAAGCSTNPLPFATRDDGGEDVDIEIFGGERDRFWAVDVSGTTVLIAITNVPAVIEGTQSVFDSIAFDD